MNSKNKKTGFAIVFLVFIFFLISGSYALALEVKYPPIMGLPDINNSGAKIGDFVKYFFGFGIYIAGALALISFAIGAVTYIVSAESPSLKGDATDRMKGAILGLILTVASFIIIDTINPDLEELSMSALPNIAGVYYSNGNDGEDMPAPMAESNTASIPSEYSTIKYTCANNNGPILLIWTYGKPNSGTANNYQDAGLQRVECGGHVGVPSGSFAMAFETPGVYYFLNGGCGGYGSSAHTSDENLISAPFLNNVKSIRIVNDKSSGTYYGAVFHDQENPSSVGICTAPLLIYEKEIDCLPVKNISAVSANIFLWNNNYNSPANQGVSFFSEPFGSTGGASQKGEGIGKVEQKDIGKGNVFDAGKMKFTTWTNNAVAEYKTACPTFQKCSGAIQLKGRYLIALYASNKNTQNDDPEDCECPGGLIDPSCCPGGASLNECTCPGGVPGTASCYPPCSGGGTGAGLNPGGLPYCQVFTEDVPNLKAEEFIPSKVGNTIGAISITPIK